VNGGTEKAELRAVAAPVTGRFGLAAGTPQLIEAHRYAMFCTRRDEPIMDLFAAIAPAPSALAREGGPPHGALVEFDRDCDVDLASTNIGHRWRGS